MKKLVLVLVVMFTATSLIGCNKKKTEDTASMEGLNGVVSENVVSVSDFGQSQEIPVVVDNAETLQSQATSDALEMVDNVTAMGKPSPKQIQQALKSAGLYTGKVDGTIGPKTKQAIEEFQSQNGLKADGKVGPKTWKALAAYLNRTPEVENPSSEVQTFGQ